MTTPRFEIRLEQSPSGLPLFQRIAEAIASEIRRGRLAAGDRLPSSRLLASDLEVHRNTVLSAYAELEAQGFLATQPARGTFVTQHMPPPLKRPAAERQQATMKVRLGPLPPAPSYMELERGVLPLLGGIPDLRTLPYAALARAYRAALRTSPETLDYQNIYGQARFVKVFSKYLAETRGVVAKSGELLVTRGSQQALYLAARALTRPGSVICVERAGYPPAWEGFRQAGAALLPVRTDKEGIVVDDLKRLTETHDVAAVYVTPHHQYPTTVTMSGPRRMALLRLAEKARFIIIEDDYDHEFHFEQKPVLPLASFDPAGVVVHIGTLSKVFAPGLRVGYAAGQRELIKAMAYFRAYLDRQGDHVTELALATLIEDGELGAHVRRMHRTYQARRETLFEALGHHLGSDLSFERPAGGLAVWARVCGGISAEKWAQRAKESGVLVQAARPFFLDRKDRPYLRLGYARLNEDELTVALSRLKAARPCST